MFPPPLFVFCQSSLLNDFLGGPLFLLLILLPLLRSSRKENKLVKPYTCFKVNVMEPPVKIPTDFGKGMLLQVAEQSSVKQRSLVSLYLVSEVIEHLFMIKIYVTVLRSGSI